MSDENERRSKVMAPPPSAPGAVPSAQALPGGAVGPAARGEAAVADLVRRLREGPSSRPAGRGRLIFAMDATMSRQPTWDMALAVQSEMFSAVKDIGGLDVQLVYFRGAGECRASRWVADPDVLSRLMASVQCQGGYTQIGKVLTQARRECEHHRIHALVYVGDCMEEAIDDVCGRAGELAILGVPVFLFQEGGDTGAARAFAEIARLTKGAHCRFDAGSANALRELLTAVAVFAAGGRAALEQLAAVQDGRSARLLLGQMRR